MTDQEKSKVICERVGIEPICEHDWTPSDWDLGEAPYEYKCNQCNEVAKQHEKNEDLLEYPNLFTPDGQVVLAKALREQHVEIHGVYGKFLTWLRDTDFNDGMTMLMVIAETKLAELFYEFIESEGS